MNEKETVELLFSFLDECGNLTKLEKTINYDEYYELDTASGMLEEFKYFLLSMSFATDAVKAIQILEIGDKIIDKDGKVIYERK